MAARIMLVEDDVNIALLIRYNLEAAGFIVEHVDRGDVVEDRLAQCTPDLLMLDWMLPGISGIELCRRIRKRLVSQVLPIVMVTARATGSDHRYALENGADAFVTKPFSVGDLVARTRALLASRIVPT